MLKKGVALFLVAMFLLSISVVANASDNNSYYDKETGVSITLPDNWIEKTTSEERVYIDAKFVSTKDPANVVMYTSADLWKEMTADEKLGYTRERINNSVFTEYEIAQMLEVSADKIYVARHNGAEYYQAKSEKIFEAYGADITVTNIQAVHIRDGWMYLFNFYGTDDLEFFRDFVTMLENVTYEEESVESSAKQETEENIAKNDKGNIYVYIVLIILFFAILAFIIYVNIVKRNKKNNIEEKNGNIFVDQQQFNVCEKCGEKNQKNSIFCHICGEKLKEDTEENTNEQKEKVCQNCGEQIPFDSVFCHFCGVKVESEDEQ